MKLDLLKQYVALQAEDDGLWFKAEYASEGYLQNELRLIAFIIEEATEEQIISFIQAKKKLMIRDGKINEA